MANFYDASKGLIEEVRARIIDLVPTYQPSVRFHSIGADPKAIFAKHSEETIRPRQFDIGPAYSDEMTYLGTSTLGEKNLHDIVINYKGGRSEEWRAAAAADARAIKSDLHKYPTSVSGVQQRRIDPTAPVLVEEDEEDDTIRLTITLMVHYEYTG